MVIVLAALGFGLLVGFFVGAVVAFLFVFDDLYGRVR